MFLLYREEPVAMALNTNFDEAPIGSTREDAGIRVRCLICDDFQDFYGGRDDYEGAVQVWEFDHAMDVCPICNECNRLDHAECNEIDPFAAFYGAVAS